MTLTNANKSLFGLFVAVVLAMTVYLTLVNAVPKTKELYKPRITACKQFLPEQDDFILSIGKRLLPGGDLHDYPLMADRATRFAYLAKLGVTDPTAASTLHMDIAFVVNTIKEMRNGFCWHSDNNLVMVMLEELKRFL